MGSSQLGDRDLIYCTGVPDRDFHAAGPGWLYRGDFDRLISRGGLGFQYVFEPVTNLCCESEQLFGNVGAFSRRQNGLR